MPGMAAPSLPASVDDPDPAVRRRAGALVSRIRAEALGATLDSLEIGLLVLDEDLRVRFSNRTAVDLLRRRQPLSLHGARPAGFARDEERTLRRVVRAASGGESISDGARLSHAVHETIRLEPLPVQPAMLGEERLTWVVLSVQRRTRPLDGLPPRLRQVALALARGRSVKETAGDLGLSSHTVADYVKALHKRFGVRSRGELLACLLASRATPRAPRGRAAPRRSRPS